MRVWRERLYRVAELIGICVIIGTVVMLSSNGACGCGYGKVACSIVDTAADACVVLRYLGPDGKMRQVRVPREELQAFALTAAARQTPTCDGGPCADGGAP